MMSNLAQSKADAVFIGEQAAFGNAVMIGRADKQEWLKGDNLPVIEVEEIR